MPSPLCVLGPTLVAHAALNSGAEIGTLLCHRVVRSGGEHLAYDEVRGLAYVHVEAQKSELNFMELCCLHVFLHNHAASDSQIF